MTVSEIVQVKRLRTLAELRARLARLGIADQLGVDDTVDPQGPLCTPFSFVDGSTGVHTVGNRFAVLPMEGWDAEPDGHPSDLVRRRWRRFGESGAKLVWGGEAVAVRRDGRANPRQLVLDRATVDDIAALRADLVGAHVAAVGSDDGLVVGLQLTHSGRWSRPTGASQPLIAYHHPVLDRRVVAEAAVVLSDDELDELVQAYVDAAVLAADAGFDFVDVKHCHGYLLHELLGAIDRPGAFGGSFEHRTTFLRRVVDRIRRAPRSSGWGSDSRRTTSCPTRPTTKASACRYPRPPRSLAMRSVVTRRASGSISPRPTASSSCAVSSASVSRASLRGAPTTTRTCNGPRSSLPPTATPRPRIRSSERLA